MWHAASPQEKHQIMALHRQQQQLCVMFRRMRLRRWMILRCSCVGVLFVVVSVTVTDIDT